MIEEAMRVLRTANYELDPREMADALWLASLLPSTPSSDDSKITRDPVGGSQDQSTNAMHDAGTSPVAAPPSQTKTVRISSEQALRDSADLYVTDTQAPSTNESGIGVSRVRVPNAPGLHNALAIARSLRPLSRRVASRHEFTLDEVATAEESAERRMLTPVFRAERERRFEVALVVEDLPSMALWRRVIAEFHRLLQQQGAFRDVRRWTLSFNDGVANLVDPTGSVRHARELRHPEARRIVLVVSDCLSEAWYGRSMASMLAEWGTSTPVAVMQLLPEHLWPRTSLGPAYARLGALEPSTPNAQLEAERPWWDDAMRGEIPLPVLTLDDKSIGEWSRLLMGLGSRSRGVIVTRHLYPAAEAADTLPDAAIPPSTIEERFDRFRALVSPDALRLASYFASVPLTLPVMRLVHSAMFATPVESVLAEVMLGGIIERVTPADARVDDNDVQYEFAGADNEDESQKGRTMRALLLKSSRRSETLRVIETVSQYVSDRIGTSFDFQALVESDHPTDMLDARARPFASLAKSAVDRMGRGISRTTAARPSTDDTAQPTTSDTESDTEIEEEVFATGLTIKRRMVLPTTSIEQIAWSPDGKWIAIRKEDRGADSIEVRNVNTATSTTIRAGKDVAITAMVWSQGSNEIAYAVNDPFGGQGVYIERVPQLIGNDESDTPPIIADGLVADMDWRLANDEISVAIDTGATQIFRRSDGRWSKARDEISLHASGRTVCALSWSRNADYLAALYSDGGVRTFQPTADGLTVVAGSAGLAISWLPETLMHTRSNASYLAWHPDAAWFAYVRPNGSVNVVSERLQPIIELIGGMNASDAREEVQLSVSRDGVWLAVLQGQQLRVFHTTHWVEVSLIDPDGTAPDAHQITRIAFSPDESTLAVATAFPHELLLLRPDFDSLPRAAVETDRNVANAEPNAEPIEEFIPKYEETLRDAAANIPPVTQQQTKGAVTWDYIIVVAGSYSETSAADAGSELAALRFHSWATSGSTNPGIEIAYLGPRPSNDARNTLEPTVDSLNSTLQSFIHNAQNTLDRGERARLILYFAGDGNTAGDSSATFVLTDSSAHQQLQAIRLSEYVDMMLESKAFHEIAVFADCAVRSAVKDRNIDRLPAVQEVQGSATDQAHVFTLTSFEPHTGSARPFTDALISGLTAGAADARGDVYAKALSDYVNTEQDRIKRSNAALRPLIGNRAFVSLSNTDFIITRAAKRASHVRVTPDRIYEGRIVRITDSLKHTVSEFTYTLRGAEANFVTINPGAYVAEIVGLQNSRAFNVYGKGEPVHVPLPWTPTPYRVLVVGTGVRDLSDRESMSATQVGLALASYGLRLVTGGWVGVDATTARAYTDQLERQGADPAEHFIQVVPQNHESEIKLGRIERIESRDRRDEMQHELDFADAVIAIGGRGGTLELMRFAEERNIPIVPWIATGSDAGSSSAVEMLSRRLPAELEWLSAPITSDEQAGATAERIAALTLRLITENEEHKAQSASSQTNA